MAQVAHEVFLDPAFSPSPVTHSVRCDATGSQASCQVGLQFVPLHFPLDLEPREDGA